MSTIIENHILCESPNSLTNKLELLIDTGSEINIIKINKLLGDLEINETEKAYLKGINDKITSTIGKIFLKLVLNNYEIIDEFHVVDESFPIPKD